MFKFKKNIKIAHQVLLLHMNKIQTIQEWANYMDYNSARVFAREFKKEFNIPPNKVIIEERLG
ncbi:MAG TPA: hypothetical protein VJ991_11235 [Balneolales bacterium]|nr:hypothetical protein [Balneolales bacterium]